MPSLDSTDVLDGVRRFIRAETRKALKSIGGEGSRSSGRGPSDEKVHDTRKRLKRARAAVRLARPALGDRAWRRENESLRDAGRPLSAIRDSRILIDTLDD